MTRTNRVYPVAHHAPLSGYFDGVFAIRGGDGPDTLRGPFEEIASAFRRTDESTVYRFDAMAQNFTASARLHCDDGTMIVDLPWVDRDGPPLGYSVSPETSRHATELVPIASDGSGGQTWTPRLLGKDIDCPNLQRFGFLWSLWVRSIRAWGEVPARAPFVRWTLIPRRRDSQAQGRTVFYWTGRHVSVDFDFGSMAGIEVLVPTASDPGPFEAEAIANATKNGGMPWPGIAHDWGGDLLGQPIVKGDARISRLALEGDGSDWGGRLQPNATGVDRCFGSTWTAPIWPASGLPDPRIAYRLRVAVQRYLDRPCHWLEPREDITLRCYTNRPLTLHKGQPKDRAEADLLRIGEQFQGANKGGALYTFDLEHRSVEPLVLYAILFGSELAHQCCDSYLAAEFYERSVAAGYVQPGRGQGLPWIAGWSLARVSSDSHLRAKWAEHDARRLGQYRGARLAGPDVTVGGLYYRATPWTFRGRIAAINGLAIRIEGIAATADTLAGLTVADIDAHYVLTTMASDSPRGIASVAMVPAEAPAAVSAIDVVMRDSINVAVGDPINILCGYSDTYEQGTLSTALLLNGHVAEAFEHGRGLVPGMWWDENGDAHGAYNQRWIGGMWPHQLAVGQPMNLDLAPAGGALGMWVGAGLRAFILAARELGRLGDPIVQIALAAIRDLDPVLEDVDDGEAFCAAHRSLWGTLKDLMPAK